MITIKQFLESVDLDFEPRFITKDKSGAIYIWADKPEIEENIWDAPFEIHGTGFGAIKLTEFHNKDWQKCIYEAPRKTTEKIEKLGKLNVSGTNMTMNQSIVDRVVNTLNQVIDAVNELKAKFELPTLNPDLTDEDLRKMMCDPKYWRDKDSATIQRVQDGFNKLYGDKN